MEKLWLCLFVVFLSDYALSVPQSNDTDSDNYELDYSEPGKPSEDCVCVPFYQCVDGEIEMDGLMDPNIIDPRKKVQDEELKLDEKYVLQECGPYHVCCRIPDSVTVKPSEHRCGTRNPSGINDRNLTSNTNGETEIGEWPWQTVILRKDGVDLLYKCEGTLIDERHVITVAHCVDKFLNDAASLVLRLGEWDTQNTDEFLPHEDYGVVNITIHPQYRSINLFNDIAILKLDREVTFKPHIDTACLPRDEDDFTGEDCVVTGWRVYESGKFSLVMKEVTVPVISNNECQAMLRKTILGPYFKLHEGFLCAGGKGGEDSCKGDTGGPLVCFRSNNSYTVAGLVSWGVYCGKPNIPGVYVNVKKYIDWITSKTEKPIEEYWSL